MKLSHVKVVYILFCAVIAESLVRNRLTMSSYFLVHLIPHQNRVQNFRLRSHLTKKSRISCSMKNLYPINRLGKSPLRDRNIQSRTPPKESETEEKRATKSKESIVMAV